MACSTIHRQPQERWTSEEYAWDDAEGLSPWSRQHKFALDNLFRWYLAALGHPLNWQLSRSNTTAVFLRHICPEENLPEHGNALR